MDLSLYAAGLGVTLTLATATWLVNVAKQDVSIVDAAWSLMFLGAALL